MHIGQRVICCPAPLGGWEETFKTPRHKAQTGKIVYIHPRRRWIVVAFGPVRESFFVGDVLQFGR